MIKNKMKDSRINAPLISIKAYFIIFSFLYVIIFGQSYILSIWLDETVTLIGILLWYMAVSGLLITFMVGIIKRYYFGRPIKKISSAAKKITKGNFSVRVEPIRKDGKKDEFEVLIEDFNQMACELESIEVLKNDFIANVTHEMRAPLSIIQSYTNALSDPFISEEEKETYIDTVLLATENMNTMITNMLKLNKLENQVIYPASRRFQLGEQLRSCALGFIKEWEIKKITLNVDVLDISICYDSSLLELVWNNLISNAIKFTEEGGKIDITSYRDRDYVYTTIRDSGCGIESENISKIFDKFFQIDTSHSTQGNGLGLALVRKILSVLKGEINVESTLGQGTAFTVKLKI